MRPGSFSRPRLGGIRFVNSLPVDAGILTGAVPSAVELVQGTPVELNEKIAAGRLDLGPVSALWYAQHHSDLLLLPDLSVSSRSPVQSVLLFSRVPFRQLKGKSIAFAGKGWTTPALLEILSHERHGFLPRISVASIRVGQIPPDFDAALVIGDEALEWDHRIRNGLVPSPSYRFDLAEEWRGWTGKPFVFAVWVVRRSFYEERPEDVCEVYEVIAQSKEWGEAHLPEVLRLAEEKTELPAAVLRHYFETLDYGLDDELLEGLKLFWKYAVAMGRLAALPLPEFAAVTGEPERVIEGGVASILKKALDGGRLSLEEGTRLYHEADLHDLGAAANALNLRYNPESARRATFVVDRNINYTNTCITLCKFCAFYRLPGDKSEGYLRTHEEIFQKIEELIAIGGTQVLMQGGHNPELGIDYYEKLVRAVHSRFPQVHIHSFSASEVWHIAKTSKLSVQEVLLRLKAAGLNSLPGGGAEILVDRVRKLVSPLKTTAAEYFAVHRAAHEAGLKSTSTMVYGLGETIEERMVHLDLYRKLQDETGGFRAFIPWSFESESTEMPLPRRTGSEYLRMVALSRLMLDNIPHVQAGWVTEGPKLSQLALLYGADDFGGILMEENVVSATGSDRLYSGVTKEEAIRLIAETGKTPTQRNTNYEIVRVFSPQAEQVLA
ncbi:MAG: dehypoxanthine futalosine cyclase [Candidatus Omnitrophica bacterium]|nr:dehypoxanthine futalosine cyclase [Candidatus Omnitrophota bacterium]